MNTAMILALIKLGREMIEMGALGLDGLKKGGYSDAQIAKIKSDAGLSDAQYDSAIAAAKARLGQA